MKLPEEQTDSIIIVALNEDISFGDVTSQILVSPKLYGKASLKTKAEGVLAGCKVAMKVFLKVDPTLKVELFISEGAKVHSGDIVATISGKAVSILKAERTALNFLQRLSGIASETARYVAATEGCSVTILDTRKTTPGLRILEKYAVILGGGTNHRQHLGDWILIKDTHLATLRALGMGLRDIIAKAKQNAPGRMKIEVEVTTAQEALDAVDGGADIIMLDNMSPDKIRQVVSLIPDYVQTEVSGGITMENIHTVAMTGVDFISIGALTHSPKALDISLEFEPQSIRLI